MEFQRHLFPAHDDELVVDNFAGGGGASTGIARAIGRSVDVAINHDLLALSMHEANHPETRHYCENILEVDPVVVCGGRPVGMAWFSPDCTHHEPLRTQTTENRFGLVAPYLVGIDNKSSGDGATWSPEAPLRTITTENRFAMVAPTLVQTGYGEREGQAPRCLDLRKPLGTVVAGGGKHALVAAFLAKHYGGVDYQIADIGLRMLQPRELARAQGFPDDYVLPGTKTRQVRAIGNSVSPPPAEALVRANYRPASIAAIGASA